MTDINQNNLIEYLNDHDYNKACSDHFRYKGWNNWDPIIEPELVKVGQIQQVNSNTVGRYWGENEPIVLTDYPYSNCEIYKCPICNAIFFFYNEDGGHARQKRYRLIQKDLIDIESIIPTELCKIESIAYKYSIYKKEDMSFKLSICKLVGVGIDVLYTLTEEEVKKYKKKGITGLDARIKDMDENYNNYKIISWR
jgi:hypothetical protein